MAKALSRPFLTCPPEVAAVSIIMSMLPASRSCEAGPALRYGTKLNWAPMVFWKNTPETWPGLPMPAVPTETLPGLALSQAISSLRLFGRQSLPADDHDGCVEISATGSRSFSRSIGRLYTAPLATLVPHWPICTV